jgi:hypothetical protein
LLTPLLTPHSHDYTHTITILVGEDEQRFTVYKDIICEKSGFFEAACSQRGHEQGEIVVRLPDLRAPYMFPVYMDWTYTNHMTVDKMAFLLDGCYIGKELVELYLLGDVLKDVELRNRTLRLLYRHFGECNTTLTAEQCHTVWEHTASASSIRKMVVDHIATVMTPELFRECRAEYPTDLALEIALMFMNRNFRHDGPDEAALRERLESYMEAANGV